MFENFFDILKFLLFWLVGLFLYIRYAYKPWRFSDDFYNLLYWLYDFFVDLFLKLKQKMKRK